jgi:hypothetical protein
MGRFPGQDLPAMVDVEQAGRDIEPRQITPRKGYVMPATAPLKAFWQPG